MSKKVFITRQIPEVAEKSLRKRGYLVDVFSADRTMTQRELVKTLKRGQYDAVLSLLTDKIDAKVFDASPSVKIFANYATGFDNIDIAEAKKRGIVVTNAPATATPEAVAEHTIAMLLALSTRIIEANDFVRAGKYDGWAPMRFVGTDFKDKTLGLVGTGRIGERVAQIAVAMGMKIAYTDIVQNERVDRECAALYCPSLEELLVQSDFVSLHVPLLDSTRHLIDEKRLRLMKSTAFLVNTARGPVVDERALEKALRDGVIAGAALDVFEFEPKVSRGLRSLRNVVLAPHIASASVEARTEMAELAVQNIIELLEGGKPRNVVNP